MTKENSHGIYYLCAVHAHNLLPTQPVDTLHRQNSLGDAFETDADLKFLQSSQLAEIITELNNMDFTADLQLMGQLDQPPRLQEEKAAKIREKRRM